MQNAEMVKVADHNMIPLILNAKRRPISLRTLYTEFTELSKGEQVTRRAELERSSLKIYYENDEDDYIVIGCYPECNLKEVS